MVQGQLRDTARAILQGQLYAWPNHLERLWRFVPRFTVQQFLNEYNDIHRAISCRFSFTQLKCITSSIRLDSCPPGLASAEAAAEVAAFFESSELEKDAVKRAIGQSIESVQVLLIS